MFKKLPLLLIFASGFIHQAANAVPCGQEHRIAPGDSLSTLSENPVHYGTAKFWDVLYQANKDRIGNNPNLIFPGVLLRIPCLDENGDLLPGQFDADGNPLPGAFDGSMASHDHSGDTKDDHDAAEKVAEQPAAADVETAAEAPAAGSATELAAAETQSATPAESESVDVAMAAPATPIRLLTGDDYGLSADRSISNGRIVYKIMDAALKEDGEANYQINFVNDWSAHLDPLLSTQAFDIGFPWIKPDCEQNPADKRCSDFLFSEPIFEIWMVLFTNAASPVTFDEDADLIGKTLCRPANYETSDLDENGRNWISEGKVTLKQPASVQQCFRLLLNNEVDAVVVNEFSGRAVLKSLNAEDKVTVVNSRPVSIRNLFAVVHKDHPRAQELLDDVNNGVKAIQASGTYQQIVDGN